MYPHRIRLQGPWDYEPLARAAVQFETDAQPLPAPLPPGGCMVLPCRWQAGGLHDFAGRVRFRRRFGWPGRLEAHERVWLTFAGAESVAQVWLNGQFLGQHEGGNEPFAFEVTRLLQLRNELLVDVEAATGNGGLWGEVALEVHSTA